MSASVRLEVHDVLPSTSDRAIALARGGAAPWTAVLAREQTAGRGRHGREWRGGRGNLFLSVVLDPRAAVKPTWWPFVAAVATVDALAPSLDDRHRLRLKWPNDILLEGAKCGGILVEAAGDGAWAVAGIGLNLVSSPELLDRPTVALSAVVPSPPQPEDLAQSIVHRLQERAGMAARGGLAAVLPLWQRYAVAEGTAMSVRSGRTTLRGRYLGLDLEGALLLRLEDGDVRRVVAGEVL